MLAIDNNEDDDTNLDDVRLDTSCLRWVTRHALLGRRGGYDVGEGEVAVEVVEKAHDAYVGDVRVVKQETLELRGRDLEAAHLEQLLDAVDDEELRQVVDDDLVAGVEPPVDERLLVPENDGKQLVHRVHTYARRRSGTHAFSLFR